MWSIFFKVCWWCLAIKHNYFSLFKDRYQMTITMIFGSLVAGEWVRYACKQSQVQSKLDMRTLDVRVSVVITILRPLTKIQVLSYKNNARCTRILLLINDILIIQLWLDCTVCHAMGTLTPKLGDVVLPGLVVGVRVVEVLPHSGSPSDPSLQLCLLCQGKLQLWPPKRLSEKNNLHRSEVRQRMTVA